MDDVFLYLSYKPSKTSKRIARVYRSLKAHLPDIDFYVVTFDVESHEGTHQRTFSGVVVPHIIYNSESLARLPYPNRATTERLTPKRFSGSGNIDFPIILFWLDNERYNKFWVMEDDV
jgi:hypothetical protein